MSSWVLWAGLLVAQNAAFTWVSRARNSGSVPYHALAAIFSNGIWILSMFLVVDKLREAQGLVEIATIATFYTAFTVAGSVGMHWLSMTYLEKGKRRVGA